MKTALIFFRSVEREFDGEYYAKIVGAFKSGGIDVDTVEILARNDMHSFRERLDGFLDIVDNLIIIDGEDSDFDIKEIIAEKTETVLAENENARMFLDAVSKSDGVVCD